jgi:hypothetical protein
MIGRWGLYGDLMRAYREAGLTPDAADLAARIAERAMRGRRDAMIRAASSSGMSMRAIAKIWGLTATQVHRLLRDAGRNVTPTESTL